MVSDYSYYVGCINTSLQGYKIVCSFAGGIDLFEFDRCNGNLFNYVKAGFDRIEGANKNKKDTTE